jgi:hypothetical protein
MNLKNQPTVGAKGGGTLIRVSVRTYYDQDSTDREIR